MKAVSVLIFAVLLLLRSHMGNASILPEELTLSQMVAMDAAVEQMQGAVKGALIVPNGYRTSIDGKYNRKYHGVCYGYLAGIAASDSEPVYSRRFIVHVPDTEQLEIAKRAVSHLLLLLWENHSHLHFDHPVSENTVELWITSGPGTGRSADAAGEQFKNQIYIYDINSARSPEEWAREISHEYGHFALPGVSGFSAPENWANGMLGERLSLKWILEDIILGRLSKNDLRILDENDLRDYVHRQVSPLIVQISAKGADEKSFLSKDSRGMDIYTGFALYFDSIYGSAALRRAMDSTLPKNGQQYIKSDDFFRGALYSLKSAKEIEIHPAQVTSGVGKDSFYIYLPKGRYRISEYDILNWRIDSQNPNEVVKNQSSAAFNAGWRSIHMQRKDGNASPSITLTRQPGGTT